MTLDAVKALCPICGGDRYRPFFELSDVPTQDGMLWRSRDEALAAPTGNIRLAFCYECGYIGNQLFDPTKIRYDDDYTFSLFFSPTFRAFLTGVARRLIDRYNLRYKAVLEVGCGEGDFLKLLCHLGQNQGLGVDPSTRSRVEGEGRSAVTFVQDWYSDKYADRPVDFICCRQALDQLPEPKAMVTLVRRNIGARRTPVYFEVPNAESIFTELLIRNIMYEKSSWFTMQSLARMFALCGFEVTSVEPCFDDGQYLGLEAVPARDRVGHAAAYTVPSADFIRSVESFNKRHEEKLQDWAGRLARLTQPGRRVLAWGSGAGGVNFLSSLNVRDEVPYVVDINPKRQGRFMPLTGQEVVPPAFLLDWKPDAVIVTNATFEREIIQQLSDMRVSCQVWTI